MESRQVYIQKFEESVNERFGSFPEPMSFVAFPDRIGGPMLFTEERKEEIYQRCIEEGNPWQDYPDIVKAVKRWHRAYMRGIEKGALY